MAPSRGSLLRRLGRLAYRAGLALYPREFRRDVGAELLSAFEARGGARRRRAGARGYLRWLLAELADLLRNLPREWRRAAPAARFRAPEPRRPMTELLEDLRFAARAVLRRPAVSGVILLVLALAVGANTGIYGVLHGVLLRPLTYPEPDRLLYLTETYRETQGKSVSWLNYRDWRRLTETVQEMGARARWNFTLTGSGEARAVSGMLVTASLLDLLDVEALLGRRFSAGEERSGERVALVSEGLWRRAFGSDPGLVGETLVLDDASYAVVGILPGDLEFPLDGAEVWTPFQATMAPDELADRGSHPGIGVVARLRPGVGLGAARADLAAVAERLSREYPEDNEFAGIRARPLREAWVGDSRPTLLLMMAAVTLVLVIACANIANLLLAQSADRAAEAAIRSALGAGRGRLLRQHLAESLLLSTAGGVAGFGLAAVIVRIVRATRPADLPRLQGIEVDAGVFLFALGLATLSGCLFGLLPAVQASGSDPARSLRADERGATGRRARLRRGLIVAEVALAFLLLVGAGLMLRSMVNLLSADPGLDVENRLTAYVPVPASEYPTTADRHRFYRRLLARVEAHPGVIRAAGIDPLPLAAVDRQWYVHAEDGVDVPDDGLRTDIAFVSPGTFRTLGTPIRAGREFDETDRGGGTPVAIVDETLARRLWPGEPAVGKRVRFGDPDDPWITVVGVVGHIRRYGVNQESREQIYLPYSQVVWGLSLVVHTRGDPGAVVGDVRAALADLDPAVPLVRVASMRQLAAGTLAAERLATRVLAAFAALAVLLAVIGLYAVISYSVRTRTREIGIRMALGARPGRVAGSVLQEGLALAALGVAVGCVGVLATARLLESLLFGVGALDGLTLALGIAAMATVAALATTLPARRAIRIDPAEALRAE